MARRKTEVLNLTFVNQSKDKLPKKFLTTWIHRVAFELQINHAKDKRLKNLKWENAELTVAFLDSTQAKKLNKMYRNRDYATDVLSFADSTDGVLGELAICPEVVKRQAKEHGFTFDQELGYLVLHGILHLLGFDHESGGREEKLMFKIQDTVFEKLIDSTH